MGNLCPGSLPSMASVQARSWINDKICSLILWEDTGGNVCEPNDGYITPMIDGGSEGFKGHVRIINPTKTASFHSTLWMFPPQVLRRSRHGFRFLQSTRLTLTNCNLHLSTQHVSFVYVLPSCRLRFRCAQSNQHQGCRSTVLLM